MTLGENIARLRTQKDWSQGDLADALGISRQSISKWETDTSIPELEKLIKLSELFGVTLDQLVHGEDAPETESVPASSAPQAAPKREKRHTIAGTALLCTGAVILVLWLLLTGDLLTGLMFALPFLICGITGSGTLVSTAVGRSISAWIYTFAVRPVFHGWPSS